MPSSVHLKDKQLSKSELAESEGTSRPSSAEEAAEGEDSAHHDEEKGIEVAQSAEKPFDARSTKTTESVIPPPPDGGLHAWLKVFGGFMIYVRVLLVLRLAPSHSCSDQYLGVYTQLWGIPSLLQVRPPLLRFPIRDILDRHCTSLATHLLWCSVWPVIRLRLLPRDAYCRQLLGRLRYHDAQLEHAVLAGLFEPGDMYGPWGGTVVYS
jgi:hypothetical protein